MKFKKLRIGWSVAWGLVAVLLIGLWVRSYRCYDDIMLHATGTCGCGVNSFEGTLGFGVYGDREFDGRWKLQDCPVGEFTAVKHDLYRQHQIALGIVVMHLVSSDWLVAAPFLYVVASFGLLAIAPWLPWLRWQFSLRTLLITTTLFALALGTIVWLTRR